MGAITGQEEAGILADKFGYRTVLATILKDASLSDLVDIGDARAVSFYMPATWDYAKLTFQAASTATGTAQNVYHMDGTEMTIPTGGAARVTACPASSLTLAGCRFIKIRTGTAAAAVTQTGVGGCPITIMIKG